MKVFLEWSTKHLNQAEIDSPRMEAEILMASALQLSREDVYLNPERILNKGEKSILRDLIERRVGREPMAYIIGSKEFWSLNFKTTPDVLIPRPATETLVETLLSLNDKILKSQPLKLLDIGTGSGVIAVIAAREILDCQVTATDFSSKILAVARTNAETHGVCNTIDFLQCDMFAGIPKTFYDFIVSNPPYIKTADLKDLMPDVRDFEPQCALDGGADGLDFYRRIVPGALDYLKEGGDLILEIGETQAKAVTHLFFIEDKYEAIKVIKDDSGSDRVVSARKRENG